eukprot:TRINITY_DN26864_c0_g1_i2.p1 TRINITY_DN26864_c0_g1~~TRINITY_DN26864_c0_g1_i2.p1  ORF type:complete len:160 (+),score=42.11 TRINITY_DN26864_c0_g1_i2:84-563(+)
MEPWQVKALLQAVEGIIRSEEFQRQSNEFINRHCDEFEDVEENQLSWMTRHIAYVELAETYIEKRLKEEGGLHEIAECLPSFLASEEALTMDEEMAYTLDFILNLTNFEDFKDTMLARKAVRNIEMLERLAEDCDKRAKSREQELAELAEMKQSAGLCA